MTRAWQTPALVLVGGACGTAAREAVTLAVPQLTDVPVATLAVNIAGSFALGWLLARLLTRGGHSSGLAHVRALVATGFLGGFTTYSAFAMQTVELAGDASLLMAGSYGLGTVVLCVAAAWAGIAVGGGARLPQPSEQAA